MMNPTDNKVLGKWAYLPLIFSSVAIFATQLTSANPNQALRDQANQEAQQVGSANYNYVGGRTQVGGHITDEGDVSVDLNHIFSETNNSSSSVGLWAGVDLDDGDGDGINEGGVQINHNWVSRDGAGNARHVNKVFVAYDRNQGDHEKATVGYGQERENLFWEGHASKGLSGKKKTGLRLNNRDVSSKAYDYGVGASVGTFLEGSNLRVRAGIDHEWGDDVAKAFAGLPKEDIATNTTLSAGVEKFFQGTPHSVSLDVAASKKDGGTQIAGFDDTDLRANFGYHYDFGGSSIYQADKEFRRVRVEIPGQARTAKYAQQPLYKRVATYKNVPVYGKKTIKKPFKQMVKSTMELEGETFFKLNSANLIPSAQTRLKQIANQIRSNGYRGAIRITGNTCGLGDAVYDQRLSEQRAKAVRSFLIKQGFNAEHLIARGLGKGHPKYPNTPSQGFKNRRVDIEYVTEQKSYKTGYRTEQQTVQTGTRRVATGFKNVAAGFKNVMIDSGAPGAPRVIWKTTAINNPPAWIKRALHNNIKHDRNVNTYFTTAGSIVTATNVAPVAQNDSETVACNEPVMINVLGNDTDADGDALSVLSFTNPANGTVTQDANGQLIYTSNGNGCGQTDSFEYTISDGHDHTSTAEVTINVKDAVIENTAPDAVDDYDEVKLGEHAVSINVLENDSDPEDDPLTISAFTNGSEGSVTRGQNGALIYTANSGFSGTDSFSYTISDGNGGEDTATVTVLVPEVVAENTAPVAKDDEKYTECRTPVTIDVLDNDTDDDDDTLKITDITDVDNGKVKIVNGDLVYTPNGDACGTTETFSYTITDNNGGYDEATVSVEVAEEDDVNQKPVAENDRVETEMNEAVTIKVLKNDSDPDDDDLSVKSYTDGSYGTVSRGSNGRLIYTPEDGFYGDDTFTYVISDGNGETDKATVSVIVTRVEPENMAPEAKDDRASTECNSSVTVDVLNNDTDEDGDTLKIVDVTGVNNGKVKIEGNKLVYTPNADACGTTENFTYSITDSNGGTDKAVVSIDVAAEVIDNKAPVAKDDQESTTEDQAVTIDVLQNDSDDDGDSLSIINVIAPSSGGTAVIVNGKILYTPADKFIGSDSFEYTISDGNGHEATATVFVKVSDNSTGNVAPVSRDDNTITLEDASVIIAVLDNDSDDDGDTLTIDSFTQGSNGSVSTAANGKLKYTPNSGFTGNDSFQYTITDGNGHSASATVSITVEAGDITTPISARDDTEQTIENQGIVVNVLSNDSSGLTISGVTQSANGFVEIVNGSRISYLPNNGFTGVDTFTYNVEDARGQVAQATVTITVSADTTTPNRPPRANEDAPVTDINTTITVDVLSNDTDPDGDALQIINVTQPAQGSASIVNNKIRYVPNGQVGSMSMTYTISDGHGHEDSTVLTIAVTDLDDGNDNFPDVMNDNVTTPQGISIIIDVLGNDTDADGDTLILDQVDQAGNGITEKINGMVRYTPLSGFVGTDVFFYGVHDGHGHNGSGKVTVTVTQ